MKYKIEGGSLPVVIIDLEQGEKLITEGGAMAWMSANMKMETTSNGGIGKVLGRMISGESLFQNIYQPQNKPGMIALASKFPGSIRVFEINDQNPLILQKRAFLACEDSVQLSVYLQKNLGAGFFGGEGFIMQRLTGNGLAFVEIDGHAVEYDLEAHESMIIDTGYLVAMSNTCTMDIKTTGGIKNALLGGEGIFNTVVTGPGKITLQTMPMNKMALPFVNRK